MTKAELKTKFDDAGMKAPQKAINKAFHDLAAKVLDKIDDGTDRDICITKIVEGRDVAMRAMGKP